MSSNLTQTPVESAMPEIHLLAGAATLAKATKPVSLSGWRVDGQGQDVRIADCGYAVTAFSTRLGPPPCSPPV